MRICQFMLSQIDKATVIYRSYIYTGEALWLSG